MNSAEQIELLKQIIRQCESLLSGIEASLPAPAKEAIMLYERGLCTECKEPIGDERSLRGAHVKCHKRIQRRIEKGELTDSEAVAAGFWLEDGHVKKGNPGVRSRVGKYIEDKGK